MAELVEQGELEHCRQVPQSPVPGAVSPHLLFMLGGTHDGNSFRQHELVGTVGVKVHTGQERRLRGVGLQAGKKTVSLGKAGCRSRLLLQFSLSKYT